MIITLHTDGASRGNPGAAAIAFSIDIPGQEKVEYAARIGITTNNQAEYQALLSALKKLKELAVINAQINCFADSELMVKQLLGEYRMKNLELRPHYEEILAIKKELEEEGNTIHFNAVRRSDNKRADHLANLALDGKI